MRKIQLQNQLYEKMKKKENNRGSYVYKGLDCRKLISIILNFYIALLLARIKY